jgi:hypothetical protein
MIVQFTEGLPFLEVTEDRKVLITVHEDAEELLAFMIVFSQRTWSTLPRQNYISGFMKCWP